MGGRIVSCDAIQGALEARALGTLGTADEQAAVSAHVARCAACAAHERLLVGLGAALAAEAPLPPAPEVVERTRRRAVRALRAHEPAPARSLLGELAVAAAVLALALPFTFAHAWLVAEGAAALLGGLLPPLLLEGLGVVYFGSLALAMGTLFAVLPPWVAKVRRGRMEAA
jgi:anti-sigma factor RsiW